MELTESKKIPGLFEVKLVIHSDNRGSFTEIFQAEKLAQAGLPSGFRPVQTNLSTNKDSGVTRGIHAEPWNKYITPLSGKVFIAILDLRSDNFGQVDTFELGPGRGLFVPKGCGNSYQTLTENVNYLYHVDAHWQPNTNYSSVNLFDKSLNIDWPVPENQMIISDKDKTNPLLSELGS